MRLSKNKKQAFTIIVGCGRLGANLANTLSDEGGSVLVIDNNKEAFRKLSPDFSGIVLCGDAAQINTLQDAQIENATAVVSVTNNDNTNILVAQIAKEMFHIQHVIARLYDPERECVYREFGIDTICPAVLSAIEIDKLLHVTGNATGSVVNNATGNATGNAANSVLGNAANSVLGNAANSVSGNVANSVSSHKESRDML